MCTRFTTKWQIFYFYRQVKGPFSARDSVLEHNSHRLQGPNTIITMNKYWILRRINVLFNIIIIMHNSIYSGIHAYIYSKFVFCRY